MTKYTTNADPRALYQAAKFDRRLKHMSQEVGTVRLYNAGRGFGFITPDDDDSAELFVHRRSCQKVRGDLKVGDRVSYQRNPAVKPGRLDQAYFVEIVRDG
jgi:cold shock CspA family protein